MMDFSPLAGRYDRLRPAGAGWQQIADLTLELLAGSTRLLDVGCGTGRFAVLAAERLGARVWGVDPSEEMLAQARARPGAGPVGWRRAGAERLPFRSGWFDAAHMHLVLHVLGDRRAALVELARVLEAGGRIALVTFRPEHFESFYLNPYFPSIPRIDGRRFPDPARLAAELETAGFEQIELHPVDQPVRPEPADLLERVQGRYISTLHLLDDAEYRRGCHLLSADLEAGVRPEGVLRWVVIAGRRSAPPS